MSNKEITYDYNFKKEYTYNDTSILKQKDVNNILSIVNSGHLKKLMKFEGYGQVTYDEDDFQLMNAHVTMQDKFNRLRTNVMVFDIFDNDWSHGRYNKLFIFKTNWVKDPTYSFVLYNTVTDESSHHPCIEYAYDTLAKDIMIAFNTMHKSEILEFYSNKSAKVKNKNLDESICETKLQPILDRYYNAQWGDPNEQLDEVV